MADTSRTASLFYGTSSRSWAKASGTWCTESEVTWCWQTSDALRVLHIIWHLAYSTLAVIICEWILVSRCVWSCGRQVDSVLCIRMWVRRWFAQWTWTSAWFYGRSYQRSPKYHKKLDTLKMFDFNTFISLCCCDWLKNTCSFKPFFSQGLKVGYGSTSGAQKMIRPTQASSTF